MSKKDILFNPYRPGDEDHLYFNDSKILKTFLSSMKLVENYFRYEAVGLGNLPSRSKALIVLNHGFIPIDLILLARKIYRQTGRRIRVLVHRRSWRIPVLREVALNIGLVDAKPENAVRLLKKGELVCVFPGGEREGMKPSGMKYQLMWEDRYGFVETAIRAGAPIIPCMSVGIDDIYHVFEKSTRNLAQKIFHRYFPFPVFLGLAGFPLPRKIVHYLGKPIDPGLKTSEAKNMTQVKKIHAQVWSEAEKLLKMGLRRRRWFGFNPERFEYFLEKLIKSAGERIGIA